jgi:transposase
VKEIELSSSFFDPIPLERFDVLSKEDLKTFARGMHDLVRQLRERNAELSDEIEKRKIQFLLLAEESVRIRSELYGKSSEKLAAIETTVTGSDIEEPADSSVDDEKSDSTGSPVKKRRILLPSERYPDAPLIVRETTLAEIPNCSCCGDKLQDSGMTEDVEYLEKIPASYQVVRERKRKYNCVSCHGEIKTTPAIPRVKPGSAFGDSVILDVAISKYCDLIPIGRQVKIAERAGFKGLPPQSLIETSHYLADFLRPLYERLKTETLSSRVLYADETPHRMLEGAEKDSWYFWGFSGERSAYFEAHATRSGEVAIEFLKNSRAEYLMSDVYSGYLRTAGVVNEDRDKKGVPRLRKIYCNAHARRKFKEAKVFREESEFFLLRYQRIYRLEEEAKGKSDSHILENRLKMREIFEEMRAEAYRRIPSYSEKSAIVKAYQYFLKNYDGFTDFTKSAVAPIDNNPQERLLRNPVIGRKTWYGTHSVRGAETAAILFSVIESCKLNGVNPREYLPKLVADMHEKKNQYTPAEYRENFTET